MEREDTAMPAEPAPSASAGGTVDPRKIERFLDEIRREQNLPLGVAGGALGAVVGAGAWAGITAATDHQIGWMAVGIGFLVGIGVRVLGKGIDKVFGYAGAILALVGCLAGNLLTVCIIVASAEDVPLSDVLSRLTPDVAIALLQATFSPMDLLFYAIAVYEGYRFSFRQVTAKDVNRLAT